MSRIVSTILIVLNTAVDHGGHIIQFSFSRDPLESRRTVRESLEATIRTSGRIGLDRGPESLGPRVVVGQLLGLVSERALIPQEDPLAQVAADIRKVRLNSGVPFLREPVSR